MIENFVENENGFENNTNAEFVPLTTDEMIIGESGCGGFPVPDTL